jgi:RES domain
VAGPTVNADGRYYRVAEPDWENPLDGSYAAAAGGRWNRPRSYPVVYLSRSLRTARLNCLHKYRDKPYGPEDLDETEAPVLVETDVPDGEYADCLSNRGLEGWGLPTSYPQHPDGRPVTWEDCWPIGEAAHDTGHDGVACRSAAKGAQPDDEELAYFERDNAPALQPRERRAFSDWFWATALRADTSP